MIKRCLLAAVRFYQRRISPLTGPNCRYYPTCSNYMIQAIQKHGSLKGTLMGRARICRCHPWATGGYDPVPDSFSLRKTPNHMTPEEEQVFIWQQHHH